LMTLATAAGSLPAAPIAMRSGARRLTGRRHLHRRPAEEARLAPTRPDPTELRGIDDPPYRLCDRVALSGTFRLALSRSCEYAASGGGPADGEALDHVEQL